MQHEDHAARHPQLEAARSQQTALWLKPAALKVMRALPIPAYSHSITLADEQQQQVVTINPTLCLNV